MSLLMTPIPRTGSYNIIPFLTNIYALIAFIAYESIRGAAIPAYALPVIYTRTLGKIPPALTGHTELAPHSRV